MGVELNLPLDPVRHGCDLTSSSTTELATAHSNDLPAPRSVPWSDVPYQCGGAESDPSELLRREVQLGRLGAAEGAGQRALVEWPAKAGRGAIQRLVPARSAQLVPSQTSGVVSLSYLIAMVGI
jgi:hypothetical protein